MTERLVVAALCVTVVAVVIYLAMRGPKVGERELRRDLEGRNGTPDFIAVCGTAVIRYRVNRKKQHAYAIAGREAGVTKRLQEILAANPEADLAALQDALGIEVQSVQRRPRAPDIDGVILGDE